MSDQLTSQSRSNESGITRRTALRGAAWSASAVTVVVATPNIAAATVTGSASGSLRRTDKIARGTVTFSNGSGAIAASTLTLTIVGGSLAAAPTGSAWVRLSGSQFRYGGAVPPSGGVPFAVANPQAIDLSDNGTAHTLTMTFTVGALTLDSLTFAFTSKNQTVNGV